MYQQDWTQQWAIYRPYHIAIKDYDSQRSVTYLQLNQLANRLTHHLHQAYEIGKGDRIALLMENSLEHVILFVAAQKLGCVLVPFNFRLAPPEINYLLENAKPQLLIYEAAYQSILKKCPAFEHIPHQLTLSDLSAICTPQTQLPEDEKGVCNFFFTISVRGLLQMTLW